jgi:hypothetical protein
MTDYISTYISLPTTLILVVSSAPAVKLVLTSLYTLEGTLHHNGAPFCYKE